MSRRIFRMTALQRHHQRLEQIVLPRYATPPWLVILWAGFGLLLTLAILAWTVQMPVYAMGPGVVVGPTTGIDGEGDAMVAVFLPPASASLVQPGQPAYIHLHGDNTQSQAGARASRVAIIDHQTLAPGAARMRYQLDSSSGPLVDGPVVVALVPLDAPLGQWLGALGDVQIQVGTQRGLALLPGVGYWFGAPL